MGMTALLCDVGQSLEVICEHTLYKHRDEYEMIVVPELYAGLASETVRELLEYAENGGKLVLVGKNTCKIFSEAGASFKVRDLDEFFGQGQKAYDNGGDNGHGGNAQGQYKAYYFTTDMTTFGSVFSPCEIAVETGRTEAFVSEKMDVEKTSLSVTVPHGKGSVSAIGFDIGSQYISGEQYMHRRLVKQICDALYTPMIKIESACGRLEVVALNKDGHLMIQLVNAGGRHSDETCATDDYIPPVIDIKLSVALSDRPDKLILQPDNSEIPFEYRDGRAYFAVERVNIHSIIEVV